MKKHTTRSQPVELIVAVIVTAVILAGQMVRAQSNLGGRINSSKSELQKIEEAIRRHRGESTKLNKEETSVVKQLAHLDKEIALSKRYIQTMKAREALLEENLEGLREGVVIETDQLARQRERLNQRLRQMYMRGPNYKWEMILGSADLQEAVRRYKFATRIAAHDASLIHDVRDRKVRLEIEQATVIETLADMAALRVAGIEENRKLEKSKNRRVAMLRNIRSERSVHAEAIDELEESKKKLQDLLADLERRRLSEKNSGLPTGEFAKMKGNLIWPVRGKITKQFGENKHPEFGTVTFNNGIDIKAPQGTPIRSVAPGTVEFVDWISGYGNCIILDHGGGYYTLYAHASTVFVAVGQRVASNEIIAEVGDSGSLSGFECHFEIRKSKTALNPLEWLK